MKQNSRSKNQVSSVFLYLLLILVAVIMFFPIMWIISSSFKSLVEINAYPPRLFVRHPKLSNYWQVISKPTIWLYLRNTLILIVGNTVGTLFSSSLVAYPLARMHFWGEKAVFAMILATMMVPATTTIIPQYLLFARLRWLDTPLPMIIPAFFAYPYNVFLFRQFFKSIPKSMDEAALIDGCSRFQIYAKIFVPLSKSTFITIGILSSVFWWNELFQPLIYINSEIWKPLTVGALTTFKMAGSFVTQWNITMAMSTLMIIPPILLYLIGQKYIVAGIKTSGMKD